ncbi:MAG: LptF/LptG family permease [Elusimicrobiota bacterium]|nr:LptF/LptG family permease [Elusimicrobiota bacterium]
MGKKARLILQRKIKRQENWQLNVQKDVTIRLDDKRVLFAKTVRADTGEMQGMFIDIYNDKWAIKSQINAKSFKWDKTKKIWFFENGFIREFGKAASVKERPFKKLESDFSVPPDQIALSAVDHYALSLSDLFKRIKFLNSSGLNAFQEYTFLNSKLAALAREYSVPAVVSVSSGSRFDYYRQTALDAGLAVFKEADNAVRKLAAFLEKTV